MHEIILWVQVIHPEILTWFQDLKSKAKKLSSTFKRKFEVYTRYSLFITNLAGSQFEKNKFQPDLNFVNPVDDYKLLFFAYKV